MGVFQGFFFGIILRDVIIFCKQERLMEIIMHVLFHYYFAYIVQQPCAKSLFGVKRERRRYFFGQKTA